MKYAVYVEGKAEILFVADVLAKYSAYDAEKVGFQCINLNADTYQYVPFPAQGSPEVSAAFYQLVNVNNDGRVISKLRKDIPNLLRQGFEIIIGLRDVFGDDYKALCGNQDINPALIRQMHALQTEQLQKASTADVRLHYAVMEYETWMMALLSNFVSSRGKHLPDLLRQIGIDPEADLEQTVFHPYNKVQEIYRALGESYGKHEGDHLSFLSTLTKDDYESLRNSGKCASFKTFLDSLMTSRAVPTASK